jgi:hypothetical protein
MVARILEHRAILACYLSFVVGLKKLGIHALKRVKTRVLSKAAGTSVRRRQILLSLPVSTSDQTFSRVTDT